MDICNVTLAIGSQWEIWRKQNSIECMHVSNRRQFAAAHKTTSSNGRIEKKERKLKKKKKYQKKVV